MEFKTTKAQDLQVGQTYDIPVSGQGLMEVLVTEEVKFNSCDFVTVEGLDLGSHRTYKLDVKYNRECFDL